MKITALVENTRTFSSYLSFFFVINRFYTPAHSDLQYSAMNNHFCIPDWLPKETVQVSDCNFDPAPPEILPSSYSQKTPFLKHLSNLVQDLH